MRSLPFSVGLLAALVLAGCSAAPRYPLTKARSAIDRIREQTRCSRAVQGEAALSFRGGGRRLRGKVLYLAHAPDQIRFDVFSSFGATLSTLTSNGEHFALLNLQERSFIYGPANTCNVQRFTRVPAPPSALVELLRGRPPVLAHDPQDAKIEFRRGFLSRGHYRITVAGQHQSLQRLDIGVVREDWELPPEKQRLRLLGVEVSQAGQLLYEVELSGHQVGHTAPVKPTPEELAMGLAPRPLSGPPCDAEVPSELVFYVPETGYEVSFKNEEVLHNPPLSAQTFSQEAPAGVSSERSLCTGTHRGAPSGP